MPLKSLIGQVCTWIDLSITELEFKPNDGFYLIFHNHLLLEIVKKKAKAVEVVTLHVDALWR